MAVSKKRRTFAPVKQEKTCVAKDRDLAQLVAHTSGGREVAGSSPVIPTEEIAKELRINNLAIFFLPFFRDFPVNVWWTNSATPYWVLQKPIRRWCS